NRADGANASGIHSASWQRAGKRTAASPPEVPGSRRARPGAGGRSITRHSERTMTANGSAAPSAVNVSQPRDWKLIVEKDAQIPLRDGTLLSADVFRPDTTEKVPVIINVSVYQKDKLWVPPEDLGEKANPHMNW